MRPYDTIIFFNYLESISWWTALDEEKAKEEKKEEDKKKEKKEDWSA